MPLAELHLSPLLQVLEVPADERIIVGVGVRGDERPTPVNLSKKKSLSIWSELGTRE